MGDYVTLYTFDIFLLTKQEQKQEKIKASFILNLESVSNYL